MATIIQKPPFVGNTGQCLVLNPREKLVYPFNLGTYQDIRWTAAISYTSATGDNSPISNDLFTPPANTPLQYPFYGFSNFNTGAVLPTQANGYDFIGVSANYSNPESVGISSATEYKWGGNSFGDGYLILSTYTGGKRIVSNTLGSSFENYMTVSSLGITGSTAYARLFGERLVISGNNVFGFQAFSNSAATNLVSTEALRDNLNSLGSVRTSLYTGYMTSGNTNSSDVMMRPNSIFIYNPMLNTRIRIHNIVVERYA